MRYQRGNSFLTQFEKDSVSELSFSTVASSMQKIQFCVHGICDPGSEIKDELVRVLNNKLDDAVFEQLNLLIARNPKCRLAPSDVQVVCLIDINFVLNEVGLDFDEYSRFRMS